MTTPQGLLSINGTKISSIDFYSFMDCVDKNWSIFAKANIGYNPCAIVPYPLNHPSGVRYIFSTNMGFIGAIEFSGNFYIDYSMICSDIN